MKKKILLILLVLLLIIAILAGFIILKKFTLNQSEKEFLSVLQDLDYSLKNPTVESTDKNNTKISFKPTSPTSAKSLINYIHEVRKGNHENDDLYFLFDVSILDENNNEMKSVLYVSNGKLVSMTLDDQLIKFLKINLNTNESDDNDIFSGIYSNLLKSGIKSLNTHITNLWNQSATINNIDLQKVFNKL